MSVIVPIYNVASYLKECLNSIISQTYSHLEIILIDDGSTDKSKEIAESFLSDSRVTLISQENQGLSGARNTGLKNAKGDYVLFIDSDDYISKDYIQEMLDIAIEYEADFVCNDHIVRFFDKPTLSSKPKEIQVCIPDASNIHFGGAVWRFLFSTKFLRCCEVEFIRGKIYEDEAFLYMIAPFASKFVRYFGNPYFYRQRQDSIMAKHQSFRSYDLLDIFEAIYLFYQKHQLLDRFSPPYSFLHHSAIGYENEKEYLCRAKALSQKLNLSLIPPPLHTSILMRCKFFCKKVLHFLGFRLES